MNPNLLRSLLRPWARVGLVVCLLVSLVMPVNAAYESDQYVKVQRTLVPSATTVEAGSSQQIQYQLSGDEFSVDPALVPDQYKPEKYIVLVLDVSGSMGTSIGGKTRMQVLKESTITFLGKMQGTKSRIAVVAYSTNANNLTNFRDMKVSSDVTYLQSFVNGLNASGSTNIGDGMRRAYWLLKNAPAGVQKYAVVMTDGEPNVFTGTTSGTAAPFKMDDGNAQYTASSAPRSLEYATIFGNLLKTDGVTSYFIGLLTSYSANLEAIAVSAQAAEASPGKHYYEVTTAEQVDAVYNNTMYGVLVLRLPMTVTFNEVFPAGVEVTNLPVGFTSTVLPDGRYQVSGTLPSMGLDKNQTTGKYSLTPWQGTIGVTYKTTGMKNYNGLQVPYTDPFGNSKTGLILNTVSITSADTTAPSVPGSFELLANDGTQVWFRWGTSWDYVGTTGYEVYRSGALIGTSTIPVYKDTAIAQGVAYSYSVRAFDAAGNKSAMNTALAVTTPDVAAPSVPQNLTITGKTPSSVSLSWLASTDNIGVTGYRLYRDDILRATVQGTTYTDTGLTVGTQYSYKVSAVDAAGNESAKSNMVSAKTGSPPVSNAGMDLTAEATSASGASVTLDGSGSSDPDGDALTYTWTGGSISATGVRPSVQVPLGVTTITLTVSDGDLTSQDTVKVTVVDTTPPVLTVPANVTAEATGVSTAVNLGQATSTDFFPATITNNAPAGGFALGTTQVVWTATDSNGNKSTGTQTVTVVDKTKPIVTAPADVIAEATGTRTTVAIGQATATDIFAPVTVTSDAPADYPLGVTTVTWSATDPNGNSATAIQKVTVRDTTKPVLTVPADITVEATAVLTPVSNLGQATATDMFPVTITNNAPPAGFALGDTTVVWTATDANGNVATATQKVTVKDTTAPAITVPANVTVEASAVSTPVSNLGQATATDIFPVTITNNAPAGGFALGTTQVVWTATDSNGNKSTGTQTVTVVDKTKPIVTAPADVIAEATGTRTAVAIGQATATDIFAPVTVTSDAPADYPLGVTTVTWSATDPNGNVATAIQKVTVRDTTKPVLTVPADITVEATAVLTPVSNLGQATATDMFPVTITNNAPPAGFALGDTTVVWTATDANGNVATATQKVTVKDTTAPAITVPANVTVEASAVSTPVSNLGQATATDIFAVTITNNAPVAGFPLGTTEVTWTATDGSGNKATDKQTVTVVDTTKPAITAPADVIAEATGTRTAVAIGQATATDIFAPVTVTSDAPADYPLGVTTVTWSATDPNGNVATAVQKVTVRDTTKPVLTVPADITVEATAVLTPVSIGQAAATDIFPVTVTNNAPPAGYPLGATAVTWTATDANGNVATATQKVTVKDTTAPVLTVPADVKVDATGNSTVVSIGQATATDIFPVTIINNAPATYPIGTTVVTWTATDTSGNKTVKTQQVVVEEIAATVVVDPQTLNLKSQGGANSATCYIELPGGRDVSKTNVATVTLTAEGTVISAQLKPTEVGDHDKDGIKDLMVKFDRQQLIKALSGQSGKSVTLLVRGSLTDGRTFKGTATIQVIGEVSPPKGR